MIESPLPVSFTQSVMLAEIQAAAERIQPYIIQTPLLESVVLNERFQARLLFKAENLQKTGAFKYRGATHFLSRMTPEERKSGVVGYSSGNHAQALAAAAKVFDTRATIIMPEDAPRTKIEGTRYYGANVVLYNRRTESREAIAQWITKETGATLIPPFDHPWIMAGQGTAGLELIAQAKALNARPDRVYIPCSGGGLLAGCGTAIKALQPDVQIFGVEPEGYDDTRQSLQTGAIVEITPTTPTLCDSLALTSPGRLTFPVNQRLLSGIEVTPDILVQQAMRLLFQDLKLVVEPGGSVGLAALLQNPKPIQGKTVVLLLSGGNVDPATYATILQNLS